MVYGRKRKTKIMFSYSFGGGAGYKTLVFKGYHGMSIHNLTQVRAIIEDETGQSIVVENWKVLNER